MHTNPRPAAGLDLGDYDGAELPELPSQRQETAQLMRKVYDTSPPRAAVGGRALRLVVVFVVHIIIRAR